MEAFPKAASAGAQDVSSLALGFPKGEGRVPAPPLIMSNHEKVVGPTTSPSKVYDRKVAAISQ